MEVGAEGWWGVGGLILCACALAPLRARSGRSMRAHWRGSRPPFASLCLCSKGFTEARHNSDDDNEVQQLGVLPSTLLLYRSREPRGIQPTV